MEQQSCVIKIRYDKENNSYIDNEGKKYKDIHEVMAKNKERFVDKKIENECREQWVDKNPTFISFYNVINYQ